MNPTTSADALTQLQAAQGSAQDPNAILNEQKSSLGVDSANQTATGLAGAIQQTGNLLKQVAPSIMGRTQGSLVTSAQADKQIQNEQAPIAATLSDETGKYNDAETNANKLESQAETNANGIYQGQQDKQSYLQNIYNTLYKQEQDASTAAENKREFDSQQATANSKVAAKAPTAAETLSSAVQGMYGQLKTVAGGDGYVSPASYAQGMQAWAAAGLSPSDYDTYMAPLRNPNNPHYALSTGKYV